MKYLRYAPTNYGYNVWMPGNKGLPDFWFQTLTMVQELAEELGLKLKRI